MANSKLTLIIDGNWLLMSRLSVLNNRFADDNELVNELKLLLIKSIKLVLKTFTSVDNIIVVADGGSWRNNLKIPEFLYSEHEIVEYKGNREKSDEINWKLIFEGYEDLLNLLNQYGINISKCSDIEGDDWCYHWSTLLNSQNTNCIIWTKDNDLKQLVKTNKDKCFTVWWNKDSGLFCENKDEEDLDFFFNNQFNTNNQIFEELVSKSVNVSKIYPKNIVIDKIIRGDAGDNIFPIIQKQSSPTSTRKYKVSTKDIDYDIDYHNEAQIRNYIYNLVESKKYKGKILEDSPENIVEHFIYNEKLVALDKYSYPQEILDIFDKNRNYSLCNIDNINQVESQLIASGNKIQSILDII